MGDLFLFAATLALPRTLFAVEIEDAGRAVGRALSACMAALPDKALIAGA
ncbi:hypothetical protein [Paracoccus sp. S1E-3]|nr:hypothetical protein [Paracoccus sp. S1E-3]MBA4489329.1 hypothetical protein [Paracoccus sp. S1E-3]